MKGRSYELALSAIACAVAALSLTLGAYVQVAYAAGYLLAVFALMVPLSKGYWRGALIAWLASFLLAFFFCGFAVMELLPYLAFFGLHPILNYLQRRWVKKGPWQMLCMAGKAVWFDLVLWMSWALVLVPLFGVNEMSWYPLVEQYFFLFLFLGGTLFFVVYDVMIFFCQRSVDAVIRRIGR